VRAGASARDDQVRRDPMQPVYAEKVDKICREAESGSSGESAV
jgi:hypothetical protein